MKVTKVSRGKDYVRFGFEMTMESEGLSANVIVNGGLSTVTVLNTEIQIIEDPEFEYEFSLFGEEVKYIGFKEMYSKLFNKKWDDFIEELDELATTEMNKHFPKSLDNLSIKDRLRYLESVISECPREIGNDGLVYITKSWFIHTLLHSMNVPNKVVSAGFTKRDGARAYGMNLNDVIDNLEYIENDLLLGCR